MSEQQSLYDDEKLWFGFARAVTSNPECPCIEEAAQWADEMLLQHRKRFPKRVEEVK